MNPRQRLALEVPLNTANGSLRSYTKDRKHATGLILRTILAVDR